MKRKIFISINIPEKVKKRLFLAMEKWRELPVKWVKEVNLHVTLFFLGYIDDGTTEKICEILRDSLQNEEIFDINFDRIELDHPESPRLVWLTGESNENLRLLHEKIEKTLDIFTSSRKSFRPHVTLGRIRKTKWEEMTEKAEISEKFLLNLPVESVDVMASHFGGGTQEYTLIESCPLG
jgi:2'-5' RNA ligase